MGNKFAKNEPSRDVEALAQETDLSTAFVTRLSERFDVLDKQKKGYLTKEDLTAIISLGANPMAEKLACTALYPPYDLNPSAERAEYMDLSHFCKLIALFEPNLRKSPHLTRVHRLTFLFRLMKLDDAEMLNTAGLEEILSVALGEVRKGEIRAIAEKAIMEIKEYQGDAIDYDRFIEVCIKLNVDQKLLNVV
ncbi:calcineurin B homologous protein 1 [Eurytemora carolleeae]|uniref:calcineurin B homologous protein 1 n=1 Tax=Eurytemora carolleeae TaxID=1294199 RepID=UPI000C7723C8|nr:calcineurin B homologous protein 1 [Eurytemora carolleeae]|eukprot:XP_023337871.1 calcineurin B homologous protein 1-like [Eurytemora affinis]